MTFSVSPRSSWLCARGADRIGEWVYYSITLHGDLPSPLRPWAFLVRRLYMLVLFVLGAPWLLRWWGLRRYVGCFAFYVVHNYTFEFDLSELLAAVRPRGVLHVGASVAQEAAANGVLSIVAEGLKLTTQDFQRNHPGGALGAGAPPGGQGRA